MLPLNAFSCLVIKLLLLHGSRLIILKCYVQPDHVVLQAYFYISTALQLSFVVSMEFYFVY